MQHTTAPTRINLWSGPRNISTAMMYSFAQRPDTRVLDEPLYAHYLRVSGLPHPGRAEVLATQNPDGVAVIQELLLGTCDREVFFFKQMTHHLVELPLDWLSQTRNVLLVRHPARVLASYSKVIAAPSLDDIGIRQSADLYDYLKKCGAHVLVVDSDRFLQDPSAGLARICRHCGIPFFSEMLHWSAGARPEDGVWAEYWYENVHKSTSFGPPSGTLPELSGELQRVLEEAMPFYLKLNAV